MVKIPAGQLKPFWIRPKSQDVQPKPIEVSAFEIQADPVTNREWLVFVKSNPEWRKSKIARVFADDQYLKQWRGDLVLAQGVLEDAPVTHVSWFAAREYCESLGLRLPTLAEWEYVAAADGQKADATRDPIFLQKMLDWYSKPQDEKGLAPVGKSVPNFYGVRDLHGLIWEWVDDFNSNMVTGESRSGNSLDKDLFCGAGGMSGGDKENYAAFMRFAFRSSLKAKFTTWNLGFRCARGGNK